MSVLFVAIFTVTLSIVANGLDRNCCKPLSENQLYKKYPTSAEVRSALQKYFCGYRNQPYVYCMNDGDISQILAEIGCVTPNGKYGICTQLGHCAKLDNTTITQASISMDFTQDSLCGYYTEPIVCCGDDQKYSELYASRLPNPDSCGKWTNEKYPPWLMKIDAKDHHCLGALINKNYVLTKASCVLKKKNLRVHLLQCQTKCLYKIAQIKVFPIYHIPYHQSNDVALLKLETDVEGAMPACLYEDQIEVNVEVTASMLTKSKSGYNIYNHTEVTVFQDECGRKYPDLIDREFCMMMQKEDCFKHSLKGAPIHTFDEEKERWYLVGISKVCVHEPPTNMLLSERIFAYLKWIKSNIS